MIRYFFSILKNLRGTKIINCNSVYLQYNLFRIEKNILQLLGEMDKKVHFDYLDITRASKLDLEVLVGMLNANIEKRKVTEFFMVLPGIFIALAIAGVDFAFMIITFIAVIITLFILERVHTNQLERLILTKELLEVYIKEKFIE